MVTTVFSDEIVNSTELRKKQKYWLEMASGKPVTVTYGQHKLTIVNREQSRNLYIQSYYLELALRFCNEFMKSKKSLTFPWFEYLDKVEKEQFRDEFISAIIEAMVTRDWHSVDLLLEDWKATAETEQDKEAMKVLETKGRKNEYVALKHDRIPGKAKN